MTREEFASVVELIQACFPNRGFMAGSNGKETFNEWYDNLKEVDYITAKQAVRDYAKDNSFPPSIHDIYSIHKDQQELDKQLLGEINTHFRLIRSYYPYIEDDMWDRYREVCYLLGKEKAYKVSSYLRNKAIDAVREMERGFGYVPFSEWLEAAEKEIRGHTK